MIDLVLAPIMVGFLGLLLLIIFLGWRIALRFAAGAFFSMLAIVIGMNATIRANVRR